MAFPKFEIYSQDKTSPRSFPWLWFVRLPAILFSIVVLGITATNHSTFSNSGCSSPSKLSYNIAVSIISFVILIYLILSTGPSPKTRLLPWVVYGQLALDAFLFILWLAAASSSRYNCNDLCSACPAYSDLYYDHLSCYCYSLFYKRDQSPVPKGVLEARRIRTSASGQASTADARKAFDALMVVVFFGIVVADLIWILTSSRHTSANTISAPMGAMPAKQDEAGMSPPAVGMPATNQHPSANSDYFNGQPMQQPQVAYQQPQMTQGQYQPQYGQGPPQQPHSQTMPSQQEQVPQLGNYVSPKNGATEVHSPGQH